MTNNDRSLGNFWGVVINYGWINFSTSKLGIYFRCLAFGMAIVIVMFN